MKQLESLVLLAVTSGGPKGITTAAIRTKIRPFADARTDGGTLDDAVRHSIDELHKTAAIEAAIAARSRASRYVLTAKGRAELERTFGELPAKAPTWSALRDRFLLPSILQVAKRAKPTFGLMRALVIAQALDGSENIGSVRTEADLLNRLAAIALRASRSDLPALREAIVRRWLFEHNEATASEASEASRRFDYERFSSDVSAAAKRSTTGRVGSKVFINHVWAEMNRTRIAQPLREDAFKAALLEANRRRLLSLSRADLSPSLPAEDVRASELDWHGDTFHFVETER